MRENVVRCHPSPRHLLLAALVFCSAPTQAQTAEQQLDRIVAKYSDRSGQVSIAVPAQAQITVAHPTAVVAADALSESSSLCTSHGGVAVESRIVKSGSVKFIKSLKCMQEGKVLWYLDFEEHKADASKTFSGDVLTLNGSLSLKRLVPSDPPQTPILSWRGVRRAGEDVDEVGVYGEQGGQFGFRYAWRFTPQAVKQLELVWRPVAARAGSADNMPGFRKPLEIRGECIEPRTCSAIWTFDAPQEWVPGIWNLALVADGLPVVSTVFLVRKH